ncbi:MAG TPA: Uma2 family endonuclease [Anaerolineae bacterium]|nr:Uma2 family endonuclease [Anaerolineae bacterium]
METAVATPVRWTSGDLVLLPENEKRYEIVDGELFVSKQPHWHHQATCNNIAAELTNWNRTTGQGQTVSAPGVIFDEENDVVPDVVWVSRERLAAILGEDGHLHRAPELVVEVLSPGWVNERRDRVAKLKLYSVHGVREYWIVDWRAQAVEVYRRQDAALRLVCTLHREDELTSPLLPGFRVPVARLFE